MSSEITATPQATLDMESQALATLQMKMDAILVTNPQFFDHRKKRKLTQLSAREKKLKLLLQNKKEEEEKLSEVEKMSDTPKLKVPPSLINSSTLKSMGPVSLTPEQQANLLSSAKNTRKDYQSCVRFWNKWCDEWYAHLPEPFRYHVTATKTLAFLTYLVNRGNDKIQPPIDLADIELANAAKKDGAVNAKPIAKPPNEGQKFKPYAYSTIDGYLSALVDLYYNQIDSAIENMMNTWDPPRDQHVIYFMDILKYEHGPVRSKKRKKSEGKEAAGKLPDGTDLSAGTELLGLDGPDSKGKNGRNGGKNRRGRQGKNRIDTMPTSPIPIAANALASSGMSGPSQAFNLNPNPTMPMMPFTSKEEYEKYLMHYPMYMPMMNISPQLQMPMMPVQQMNSTPGSGQSSGTNSAGRRRQQSDFF